MNSFSDKNVKSDKCHGSGFGKPSFPNVSTQITEDLTSFVGSDSWMFFKLLKINPGFLEKPVTEWEFDNEYKKSKYIVDNIQV